MRHFGKKTRRPNGQSGAVHVFLAIIMRPSSTPDWLSIEASVQSGAASTPPVPIYAATPSPLAATFPKKKTRRRSVRVALPLVGFIGSPEKNPPTQPLPTLHRISLAPTSGLPQRCTPTRFLPSFFFDCTAFVCGCWASRGSPVVGNYVVLGFYLVLPAFFWGPTEFYWV